MAEQLGLKGESGFEGHLNPMHCVKIDYAQLCLWMNVIWVV